MHFEIHALDHRRQVVALALEAPSEAAALEAARQRGLEAFSARPLEARRLRLPLARRRAAFPTLLFSIELLALLEAGLNLVEALQTLAEKDGHGERHEVLAGILAGLRRGEPFSGAVAAYPRHFSPLYVATLRASERTGDVAEALGRYVAYQEEFERVRKRIVAAAIYPAILIAVGSLVMGFLLFYVVPRFASVYEDRAGGLPLLSRWLLAFGSFVGEHAWVFASSGLALGAGAAWALSRAEVRAALAGLLWRVPTLGAQLKTYQLARLYRTAGMLLRAGVPAMRALEMAGGLLAAHLRGPLGRARALIEQGQSMSAALAATGLATAVATRMMAVGEKSGDMGAMLTRVASFHDEEVARTLEWLTRAFEPVLMAVLGACIGLVVVLMYLPIFELAGSLR